MNAPAKPDRNVRVVLEVEIYVPDAKSPVKEGASEALAEYQRTQLDDETHERVDNLVHELWEAGDPDDVLNATVVVNETHMIGGE